MSEETQARKQLEIRKKDYERRQSYVGYLLIGVILIFIDVIRTKGFDLHNRWLIYILIFLILLSIIFLYFEIEIKETDKKILSESKENRIDQRLIDALRDLRLEISEKVKFLKLDGIDNLSMETLEKNRVEEKLNIIQNGAFDSNIKDIMDEIRDFYEEYDIYLNDLGRFLKEFEHNTLNILKDYISGRKEEEYVTISKLITEKVTLLRLQEENTDLQMLQEKDNVMNDFFINCGNIDTIWEKINKYWFRPIFRINEIPIITGKTISIGLINEHRKELIIHGDNILTKLFNKINEL